MGIHSMHIKSIIMRLGQAPKRYLMDVDKMRGAVNLFWYLMRTCCSVKIRSNKYSRSNFREICVTASA